jgi:hypothetical protein
MTTENPFSTQVFASQLTASAKLQLDLIVEALWQTIGPAPDFSKKPDVNVYEQRRSQYRQFATLTAVVGADQRMSAALGHWGEMQKTYAQGVRSAILAGHSRIKDEIQTHEGLLQDERAKKARYDELHVQYDPTKPDLVIFQEMQGLMISVFDVIRLEGTLGELQATLQGIDTAAAHLQAIVDLPPLDRIHYRILTAQQTLDNLGASTYAPPAFEPFTVLESTDISDIFDRAQAASPVRARQNARHADGDFEALLRLPLPPIMTNLLTLKHYIDELPAGTEQTSTQIVDAIREKDYGQEFGLNPKGTGGYLERSQALFGVTVTRTGARRITKRPNPVISPSEFYERVLNELPPLEGGQLNEFYIKLVLETTFRECPEGYTGFTLEDLTGAINSLGFPITRKNVGSQF